MCIYNGTQSVWTATHSTAGILDFGFWILDFAILRFCSDFGIPVLDIGHARILGWDATGIGIALLHWDICWV